VAHEAAMNDLEPTHLTRPVMKAVLQDRLAVGKNDDSDGEGHKEQR